MVDQNHAQESDSRKPKGWFSRKHQTRAEHEAAVAKYRAEHGKVARRHKASERAKAHAKMSPAQRIAALDRRLGKGVGASKERARLA